MAFDPRAYLEEKGSSSFDPQAYLEEKKATSFDPQAYLAEKEPSFFKQKPDPSLGQIGSGIGAEILLGEGLKYGLTSAGFLVGGPIGAAIGYGAGALIGGITGSLAAQRIEKRDEISWGRVTGDTLLNTLPPFGKVAKGAKLMPKLLVRGGTGAAVGASASATEQLIDEGEIDLDRLLVAGATGGALNIGLGAASDALADKYTRKLSGKTQDEVNANYKKGDPDTVEVVDAITGGDPRTTGKRMLDTINSYIIPTKILKKGTSEAIRESQSKLETASDSAATAGKIIDNVYVKASREGQDSIDAYVSGKSDDLIPEVSGLKQTLDDAKQLQEKAQRDLLDLDSSGDIELPPLLRQSIEDSIRDGGYKRTTYKFFEDVDYQPTEAQRNSLIDYYQKEGKTIEEIESFLVGLNNQKAAKLSLDGLNFFSGSKNFLKKKKELPKELQEYLGIYERPGEKVAATIKGLGRYAARELGDANIRDNLIKSNLATPQRLNENYVELRLGGKSQPAVDAEGNILYVPKEIQKGLNVAINQDYGFKGGDLIDKTFGKLLGTTTGLTKFSAVVMSPLNYPSQMISNQSDMLALGINPFKSLNPKRYEFALNDFNSTSNKSKFVSDMLKITKGGKPNIARINRLKELQLMDKGVFAGDIANAIKNGFDIKSLQKAQTRFGKFYNIFDTTQRLIVFDHFKNFIRKQASKESVLEMGNDPEAIRFAKSKLGEKASDRAIKEEASEYMVEKIAAEITNSQFPNYGRVSPLFKTLSRYGGVNEFGSYISEQLRTKYNQFAMSKNLVDGKFAKELNDRFGLEFNQAALAKEGGKKYGRLAVYLGALGAGYTQVYNAIKGMSSDEQEAYKRSVAAEWDEFNPLLIEKVGEDKYQQINTSYQIPATDLMEVANAAMRGENAQEVVGNAFQALFSKLQGQGLGQTINMRLIQSIATNRDPVTGDKITPREGLGFAEDMAKHYLYKGFVPSVAKQLYEGRFMKDTTATKKSIDLALGLRRRFTTVEKGASFKMRNIAEDIKTIKRQYGSASTDAIDGERVNLEQKYLKANQLYKSKLEKALVHINDYKTLGLSDEKIRKIIKSLGLRKSELDTLMTGRIPNLSISSKVSGKKSDAIKRYAELGLEMPQEMFDAMLDQDLNAGKIKESTVKAIQSGMKLMELYK